MYYGECEVHNLQWFEKVDECPACKLAAELAAQTAVIEAAREVITDVEWGASDDWGRYCPSCGNYQDGNQDVYPENTHKDNCELKAWLSALDKVTK